MITLLVVSSCKYFEPRMLTVLWYRYTDGAALIYVYSTEDYAETKDEAEASKEWLGAWIEGTAKRMISLDEVLMD